MMYKIPYRTDMILNFFGKRECFSYQSGNSLSHCVIKPLNMIGFSSFFTNRTMPFGRKNFVAGRPEICIRNGTLPVNSRYRIPKPQRPFLISISCIDTCYFSCILIYCEPNPLLIIFISDKRPHFIALYRQPALRFFFHINFFRRFFIFFIHIILQPTCRNICDSYNSCEGNSF